MTIAANLVQIQQRIQQYQQCHARPEAIKLLAVSKTKPNAAILAAYQAGQRLFGENYVQEAVEKSQALHGLLGIEWHFIGPIQSNKSRLVAENMHWVQSVDREKIARRLSEQRPPHLGPLNVCLQVNLSGEATKSGMTLDDVSVMAELVTNLPNLTLRGLMAIPAPQVDPVQQRLVYAPLVEKYHQLQQRYSQIDTLSIGMSDDMEAAIAAGSTMVRIGTAVFGARDYPVVE
jgi:pyridoxal phosphate enzyme (YggS family)